MGAIAKLIGGAGEVKPGTIGRAAALVRAKPRLLDEVVDLLSHPAALVRTRAADVLEKASAQNTRALNAHKDALLEKAASTAQPELRWHFAQVLVRLDLCGDEIPDLANLFQRWYARDTSRNVRTFALQGMTDLARLDPALVDGALAMMADALESPSPAVRARAKRVRPVLERLKAQSGGA